MWGCCVGVVVAGVGCGWVLSACGRGVGSGRSWVLGVGGWECVVGGVFLNRCCGVCLFLSLNLSQYLCLSVCLFACQSLCLSIPNFQSVNVSFVSVCLSQSLCVSAYLSVPKSVSASLNVSVCLSISISIPQFTTGHQRAAFIFFSPLIFFFAFFLVSFLLHISFLLSLIAYDFTNS